MIYASASSNTVSEHYLQYPDHVIIYMMATTESFKSDYDSDQKVLQIYKSMYYEVTDEEVFCANCQTKLSIDVEIEFFQ